MSIESMGWDVIITAHAEYYLGDPKRLKKTALAKIELYDPELGESDDFIAKVSRVHRALADALENYPDGEVIINTTFREGFVNG